MNEDTEARWLSAKTAAAAQQESGLGLYTGQVRPTHRAASIQPATGHQHSVQRPTGCSVLRHSLPLLLLLRTLKLSANLKVPIKVGETSTSMQPSRISRYVRLTVRAGARTFDLVSCMALCTVQGEARRHAGDTTPPPTPPLNARRRTSLFGGHACGVPAKRSTPAAFSLVSAQCALTALRSRARIIMMRETWIES